MKSLRSKELDTPLGPMLAVGSQEALYILEFLDRPGLDLEVKRLQLDVIPGEAGSIEAIENELKLYFKGELTQFKTPLAILGTSFRNRVWEELRKIPFGNTISYAQLANAIGKPSAFRAVAQANGANQLALIIPCHRVIYANGDLGGYAGGLVRKKWLLQHELGGV